MRGGGCFCSAKTKLRSEEELKNGGKREEVDEGRQRMASAALFALAGYLLVIGGAATFDLEAGGPQQRCRL